MESQINSLETRIKKMQERFNKDLEEIKESQYIMNNAINEIKNTLEATNSRITEFTITPPSLELFIGAAGVSGVPGSDWTTINPGPDIAISGIENLNADLSSTVFALGFDIVEPTTGFGCNNTCVDTTFSAILKNGPTTVGSFQFNAPDNVLAFVGVSSDLPFDRVEILDITANIDDEYFGEFYTSSINPSPPVSCGPKTVMNSDNQCIPDLSQVCGQGTIPDFDLLMCFGIALGAVGGELLEINTVSLLVGAIGTNPVITGLVGITLAGIVGQAVWFIHKRKKRRL